MENLTKPLEKRVQPEGSNNTWGRGAKAVARKSFSETLCHLEM